MVWLFDTFKRQKQSKGNGHINDEVGNGRLSSVSFNTFPKRGKKSI